MSELSPERPVPVQYPCRRCGGDFTVYQGDPDPDEDITICWVCIDAISAAADGS
jgi:hypothetical protein